MGVSLTGKVFYCMGVSLTGKAISLTVRVCLLLYGCVFDCMGVSLTVLVCL